MNLIYVDLKWKEIKALYNAFNRNVGNYQKVIEAAGQSILREEPKWSIFNQRPYIETVAFAFADSYPDDAARILRRDTTYR